MRRIPIALVFTLFLAACGGRNSSAPVPLLQMPPQQTEARTAEVAISGDITAAAMAAVTVRVTVPASATSARSLGISANKGSTAFINLTPGAPGCANGSGAVARICTVNLSEPVGGDTFALTSHTGTAGTGSVLASAIAVQTVSASAANTLKVALGGTVASIRLTLANTSPLQCEGTITTPLSVSTQDAGANFLVGSYTNPVTITDGDKSGNTSVAPGTVAVSSTVVTVTYKGLPIAAAFGATATGVSPSAVVGATLSPGQLLYVPNIGSVTIYAASANGNVAPLRTIAGSNTQINNAATGVAHDAKCNVYVSTLHSILKFGAGANGNVAPIANITGSNTQLHNDVAQIAVGSTGTIFVASPGASEILEFASGANGNVAPAATINVVSPACGGGNNEGVALDAQANIYVSSQSSNCIAVYAPGAHGPSAPLRVIAGTLTGLSGSYGLAGLAIGSTGKLYAADISYFVGNHAFVYPAGANGNVPPLQNIKTPDGQLGIAVNSGGNIYVATSSNSIKVFAANASGSATPIATIAGSNTGLSRPLYISI